jgi:hypothetical protein
MTDLHHISYERRGICRVSTGFKAESYIRALGGRGFDPEGGRLCESRVPRLEECVVRGLMAAASATSVQHGGSV